MLRGLSPLAIAAKENDTQFLRLLLAAGANPSSPSALSFCYPLSMFSEVGKAEGLTILHPVTESHSRYPDWSICGIENRFHSESAKTQWKLLNVWVTTNELASGEGDGEGWFTEETRTATGGAGFWGFRALILVVAGGCGFGTARRFTAEQGLHFGFSPPPRHSSAVLLEVEFVLVE
ncbi:hypothetical protein CASFOL_022330 [Castilleja foliolosa]|uniref:Ankyrin repeat protein n=1 Tax=Castilleja foliolosa TaxID=1961234 RepID=A0ABD3CUA4_9LAMI